MDQEATRTPEHGCPACWPADPAEAYAAVMALDDYQLHYDESHFIVTRRRCAACGQLFAIVFTELIGWDDGMDPQHRSILPLSPQEWAALPADGPGLEAALRALAPERRTLQFDWASRGLKRIEWGRGVVVERHD